MPTSAGALPPRVFLDTSYVIALLVPQDQHHATAAAVSLQMIEARTQLVTTQAVLVEIGNALSRQRYRATCLQTLRTLRTDPATEIVPLSDTLFGRALDLYEARPDREWGLADCMSFVVMEDLGLTDALTTDRHFEQAGYRALLRSTQ